MLGVKEPNPLEGLPTLEDVDWQLEDDPWAVYRWASKEFESMEPGTPLARRIRVTNHFMKAAGATDTMDLAAKHIQSIEESWQKADSLGLGKDRTTLGHGLAFFYRSQGQFDKANLTYKQTLEDARKYNDLDGLINTLIEYGRWCDTTGQEALGTQYNREAQALIANTSLQISPFIRHAARISAALLSYEHGTQGLHHIIEESLRYFMDKRLRFATAIYAFNVANLYSHRDEDIDRALYYLEVSLKEARSLQDKSTIGAVFLLQASIARKRGQYNLMEEKASQAVLEISNKDKFWLGRALFIQATAFWKLKKYSEGLAATSRAVQLASEEWTNLRKDLYELQAALQEELHLYKEAVDSHKEYQKILAKIAADREKDNFAKARVELGLQMEEQKNQLLQKENELQAARLKTSRYLLIAAIALGILLLGATASTIWALSNSRKIQKAREKIQIILDVIEEGILTINRDLRPEPEYSRYLTRLYPALFEREEDAIDWLFPEETLGQERQSIIRETLRACLGEESLSWDLNAGQLPSEIILPGEVPRSIHILWQPLLNSEERIKGFLLSLRDMSDQKRLQDEVLLQKEKSKALEQRVQELLLTRFQDARRLIDTLEARLEGSDEIWLETASKRDLHTRKGEARTLGLKGLSEAIHSLESALCEGKAEVIAQALMVLREETGAYHTLMRDMFTSRSTGQENVISLMDVVGPLLPALRKQLREGGIPVRSIDVSDGVDEWPAHVLEAVRQSLLHALSNSADHGYILPSRRGQRLSPAVLRVEADTDPSGKILVRVRDFGAGLNLEKLKAMAEEKGFTPSPEETVADVVFLDGATTAETASATSGRGVGLSAVRELCRSLKGDAHLLANDQGQGSLLLMSFEAATNEHLKNSA
ncbi:MAG: ATP-binding protein [Pseudobdellovibrionaceae bacterium]|nr:ATP-binding protein [Pseudobdellovibrionaceae bacterium]